MATRGKIRWGDTLDDDDVLPPSTVKGPDDHGIKIVTEYYKNDKGEAMKKVSKTKVVHVEKKVYKVSRQVIGLGLQPVPAA
jgi:translation initiation factor 3 subunit G